mmetsp:Transcript_106992/g.268186  ORF Transcript_106992/g.268186 Transcript_106992/m.268186 type:complete len:225 (-) Transcript_106992:607-1281(-)
MTPASTSVPAQCMPTISVRAAQVLRNKKQHPSSATSPIMRIQLLTGMRLPRAMCTARRGTQHKKISPITTPILCVFQPYSSSNREAVTTSTAEMPKARKLAMIRQPQTTMIRREVASQPADSDFDERISTWPSAATSVSISSFADSRSGWRPKTTPKAQSTTAICPKPTCVKSRCDADVLCPRSSPKPAAAMGPAPMASIPEKTHRVVCSGRSDTGVRCNMLAT